MVLKHLEVYLGPFQQMIKLFAKIFFAKITPPQIFDRVPDIVLTLLKVNSKHFPRNCSDLLRNVCQVSILEHLLNHFSKFTFPLTFSLKNHCFYTAQKIKFSIKDFFSKCDQIRRKLRIWSHLLKKSLMESFIFCALLLSDPVSIH